MKAILCAFLAAIFYAINIPASKVLLRDVGPTMMAALLYLGAGIGIAGLSLFSVKDRRASAPLSRRDLPYVVGMIVLDIAAPIFLMLGIRHGTSANASLLGNFEIVATTLIALLVFRETVSKRLWAAIALITAASAILSFDGAESLRFSRGSILVLAATVCWGLENNCTRKIASLLALAVMLAGAALVVVDTLVRHHTHPHQHTFTHFHGGMLHTHTITHTHGHDHFVSDRNHDHRHSWAEP